MSRPKGHILFFLPVLAGLCAGCGNGMLWGHDPSKYVKPSIAVMKFENRASFAMRWNLGDGTKDVLVDRLVATERFQVIERPELDSVMKELRLQHSGVTREQRRAALGRIKNVQYLIKGTITDFGHVSTRNGFLGTLGWNVGSGRTRAVMGMTMYVVDVESGEIICSESIVESVRAGDVEVKATYKGVAFGGSTFSRTPLGRATAKVIGKAVKRISKTIAARKWQPRIALVQPNGNVVINGGKNRKVKVGAQYEVYDKGDPIIDPDTGDVIGEQPGKSVGHVRVYEVCRGYSVAVIVKGRLEDFQVAQHCRVAQPLDRQ